MSKEVFPRLERGHMIEVARMVKGRPSYVWVQGWVIRYSETRTSMEMRYQEARTVLAAYKEES